jgi:hypothetical protein
VLAVRRDAGAFRLAANLDGVDDGFLRDVDHRQRFGILVRDEQLRTVVADDDGFRIGSTRQHANEFALAHIDHADAVRAAIRRRQRFFVDSRSGVRRIRSTAT